MNIPIPEVVTTWPFWAVAVACYILCEIIKQIPSIKQSDHGWIVNLCSIVIGVLLLCLLVGWTGENVVFGILAAAASTLAYELWSNILAQIVDKQTPAEVHDDGDTKVGGSD